MSLVIAVKCKDGVLMGADSAIVLSDDHREIIECESNQKIWNPKSLVMTNAYSLENDSLLIGGVGNVRDSNVIRAQLALSDRKLSMDLLVNSIVPIIREILIKNGFLSDVKPYVSMESSFIIADKKSLFIVGYDYSVIQKKNIAIIGCCEDEAKALVNSIIEDDDLDELSMDEAEAIITSAMKNCSKNCTYISLPIYFSRLDK